MSSLRAIDVPAQRTAPVHALPTERMLLPRAVDPQIPLWAHRVEATIEAVARFGFSPTPTILLVSGLTIAVALRAH